MENEYAQILIDHIQALCEKRGITAHKLSSMSGVSDSTVYSFLNSQSVNPRIKTLHKIALAFNMTLAEFLDFPELNAYSFEDEETEDGDQEKMSPQQAP